MTRRISRRNILKGAGVAGVGALLAPGMVLGETPVETGQAMASSLNERILPLTSTSEVIIPPPGHAFMKFSFSFPEPSVAFEDLRIGFRVNTFENVYALDQRHMIVKENSTGLEIRCSQLLGAGGQEVVPGRLEAYLSKRGPYIECYAHAEARHPIKSIAIVVRGVPRGDISCAGQTPFDPKDDEVLLGYPFSAGGLFGPNAARSMETPIAIIRSGEQEHFFLSCLDNRVRSKRFYFQPGEHSYRVDLVFEQEGWQRSTSVTTPSWRIGRTPTLEEAMRLHYDHVERAFSLPAWEKRDDVPDWFRKIAVVVALHGSDWTGYTFNTFAKMSRILEWVSTQIPAENVLVFLPAWDGRYYWNYPLYRPDDRLGGARGFADLIRRGHQLGFRFIPMFGANVVNKRHSVYSQFADAATAQIDGDPFSDNWTDWDRDGHQEGGQPYLNLGVDSWRQWLSARITDIVSEFNVDGYFLDIAGGWVNNPKADMDHGTRQLVESLRERFPHLLACGEFYYDALLSVIPVYQAFGQWPYDTALLKYARAFQHLSHPAPGRGSTGVHELGFRKFDPVTLSLNEVQIPTITVVDDTFESHREVMAAIISRGKRRAGIRA